MRPGEFDKFSQMLQIVAEQYGRTLSPSMLKLYWVGLEHFDLQAVRKGLNAHVRNPDVGQFMPKIADIVRSIEGTNADAALLAWAKVEQAVKSAGAYDTVAFDDPIIHAVLADMGGWIEICGTTEKDWDFRGNEFAKRYRGYKERTGEFKYPQTLIGIFDRQNLSSGYPAGTPKLIGDQQKALSVVKGGTAEPRLQVRPMPESIRALLPKAREAA
jgi:hypothetical protein